MGKSVAANGTVANLETLRRAAKDTGMSVFVSPHYYFPADHGWRFGGALEQLMHAIGMFDRKGGLTLAGFKGSGADWLDVCKPYVEDGKTVFASPHKVYGPETNDLVLQLRKRGIDKLILAGMSANLCVEAHLRALSEQDFAVAEVKDATAAAQIREGDGYAAAVTLPLPGQRRLDRLRGQDEDRRIEDCQVTPVGAATRVVAPRGTASLVTWNLRIQRCCHALARRFGACLPGTSTRPRSLTLCSRTGR